MKKIFITAVAFLLCFAGLKAQSEPNSVKFLYINGSNNNTKDMKDWYFNGVKKLHPYMKKAFEGNEYIYEQILDQGSKNIDAEPFIFFWGDRSQKELESLNQDLAFSSMVSTKIAQLTRQVIAHCFHDAIWVQKEHNMRPIIKLLHDDIVSEYKKGNQVILFGYSAGSFVTYQYLFLKLPDINVKEFFYTNAITTQEERDFIATNDAKDTCIDALVDSGLVVLSMDGKLIPNRNTALFKQNYQKLDSYTANSCIIPGSVKGVVNFASPIPLFYSDVGDTDFALNKYNVLMYKYMIENNLFWLTVNFREDPLGYPTVSNLNVDELEKTLGVDIRSDKGFFFDKSDVRSGRTFMSAHTSYWNGAKRFSKAVAEAFEEGIRHNYASIYEKKN